MNKFRKGFTLIETVMSLTFVGIFIVLAIYVPASLVSQYKTFQEKMTYTDSVISIFQAFSKDTSQENGEITINNETKEITLNGSTYSLLTIH